MEEKGVLRSCPNISEARDGLCAMYFGMSCAFYALKNLPEQTLDDQRCSETREKLLQGSAQLLGLLVWRVQRTEVQCELLNKLEAAESEISELKNARSEDAKANERVARIYAAQEQSWLIERRKLRQQVDTLLNDIRILDRRKSDSISELNDKLQDMEFSVKSKEKILEEVEKKRKELDEKAKSMEVALEELRETTKREAEEHSSELMKHKTAFIELVSAQRQLEAEFGRSLRQLEATKEQLDYVFDEKEEAVLMVQELSVEIEKLRKDSEQKDRILSAMMKKSKIEFSERQMLSKEAKASKLRRNKSDLETERWRNVSGSRNGRTLRNLLSRQNSSRLEAICDASRVDFVTVGLLDVDKTKLDQDDVDNNLGIEPCKGHDDYSLPFKKNILEKCCEFDEAMQLDEWIHLVAERYHDAFEQRHQLQLDSFSEQIQMKDDKLEAYRWRLFNAELESKRLQAQIEGLNKEITQLRHDNIKLENLLLNRDVELNNLKDQIALQLNQLSAEKTKLHSSRCEPAVSDDTVWANVKLIKKKPSDKEKAKKNVASAEANKEEKLEPVSKDRPLTSLSPTGSVGANDISQESLPANIELSNFDNLTVTGNEEAAKLSLNKRNVSTWKVDLHALGVSYKIKRLNQQLLMLDRLTEKKECNDVQENVENGQIRMKGFSLLLSLLKKQVSRYQSLQEKADDLSKRMGEKDLDLKRGVSNCKRTKEETRKLEHFLEQTFQLQRFIVATGQKLMEIQSKMSSGFVGIADELPEGSASFDMNRFAETIQTLLRDVQRGLEVRISRIIGDLGGTLACDGIHFMK